MYLLKIRRPIQFLHITRPCVYTFLIYEVGLRPDISPDVLPDAEAGTGAHAGGWTLSFSTVRTKQA